MTLPVEDKARKAIPLWDGCIMYFPKALMAVAEVSRIGNEQHNPGEPLHWAKDKSTDQKNTAIRHMVDHDTGLIRDTDGARHLAKAAWRVLAWLETEIEAEDARAKRGEKELRQNGEEEGGGEGAPTPPQQSSLPQEASNVNQTGSGLDRQGSSPTVGNINRSVRSYGPGDRILGR